jgi:hypothetical protein
MSVTIAAMTASDRLDTSRIFQEGIDTGNVTFATQPPASWDEWCKGKITTCSLIARNNDEIVGWAP